MNDSVLRFEWYEPGSVPTVTLAEYGVMFNTAAYQALGSPNRVGLGFDKDSLVMAVAPMTGEHPKSLRVTSNRQYHRVNTKEFIRYVLSYLPKKRHLGAQRYMAAWDRDLGYLLVDLKADPLPSRGRSRDKLAP